MNEPPAARPPRETSRDGPLLRLARARPVVTLVLALLIGLAGACGAILFRELYLLFQTLAFGTGEDHLGTHIAGLPAWQILAAPTLGGLAIGLFVHFAMPGGRPQGVADVVESAALRAGGMDWGRGSAARR